ncbi:MAG TPA: AtpZ/AtpI family protein [Bryobacteraceae bacterium]|nr:AtpZ/AtpI family protein [Bryobacteraceae bacterium]
MPESDSEPKRKLPASTERMMEQVELRAGRMIRGRKRGYRNYWRAVALVGLVGWTVVVPMLIGIAVGTWIDHSWPSRFSWTLMLMVGGLGFGCMNAWNRVKEAQEDH